MRTAISHTRLCIAVPAHTIAAFFAALTCLFAFSVPAEAQWRENMQVFRIGIVADGGIAGSSARVEAFRLSLEEKLDLPVEVFTARDYPALVDAATDRRIEYAILSASAYAAAWNLCECIEPLVMPMRAGGSSVFAPAIIAPLGGPSDVTNMRFRKLGVVDNGAVGGHMLALHTLDEVGLSPDRQTLSVERYGDSDGTIVAMVKGEVDAILGWVALDAANRPVAGSGTLGYLTALNVDQTRYRIIWQAPAIPYRVHAVLQTLPGELKTILRQHLSSMFENDPVAYDSVEPRLGGGFVSARHAPFAPLAQMLADKGIRADAIGSDTGNAQPQPDAPVSTAPSQDAADDTAN